MRVSCDLVFLVQRKRDALTNGDFLCKCKFPLPKNNFCCFLELLQCLQFLKNKQFRIILCQRHILGEYSATLQAQISPLNDFRKNLTTSISVRSGFLKVKNLVIFVCFFVLSPAFFYFVVRSVSLIPESFHKSGSGFTYQRFD